MREKIVVTGRGFVPRRLTVTRVGMRRKAGQSRAT